mmetsp:Transcript_22488/g.76423  ORF Transcript_22488/g.76423 Transcript_22488/m.76423 type:complete len:317 (+) Transcript_22488:808-1758(+)
MYLASGDSDEFWIVISAFSAMAGLASCRRSMSCCAHSDATGSLASISRAIPSSAPAACSLTASSAHVRPLLSTGSAPASRDWTLPYGCWHMFLRARHTAAIKPSAAPWASGSTAAGTCARSAASTPGSVSVTCARVSTPLIFAVAEDAASPSMATTAGTTPAGLPSVYAAPSDDVLSVDSAAAAASRTGSSPSVSSVVRAVTPSPSTTALRPSRRRHSASSTMHASRLTSASASAVRVITGGALPYVTASALVSWLLSSFRRYRSALARFSPSSSGSAITSTSLGTCRRPYATAISSMGVGSRSVGGYTDASVSPE